MIPSWLVIGGITIALGALSGPLTTAEGRKWFKRLQRPQWLTFEAAIPVIWTVVFICGAWSAYIVWEADPGSLKTWLLMAFYLLVEIVTLAYTIVMLWVQHLRVGTLIGGAGFVLALVLAILVGFVSIWATVLLLPYLLWSPVGTYTTWRMEQINPSEA